jgi:hypothetical protein
LSDAHRFGRPPQLPPASSRNGTRLRALRFRRPIWKCSATSQAHDHEEAAPKRSSPGQWDDRGCLRHEPARGRLPLARPGCGINEGERFVPHNAARRGLGAEAAVGGDPTARRRKMSLGHDYFESQTLALEVRCYGPEKSLLRGVSAGRAAQSNYLTRGVRSCGINRRGYSPQCSPSRLTDFCKRTALLCL